MLLSCNPNVGVLVRTSSRPLRRQDASRSRRIRAGATHAPDFTSEHGDLLGSHGFYKKQQPYDESIRVPFLLHYPGGLGLLARRLGAPISTEGDVPDIGRLAHVDAAGKLYTIVYTPYPQVRRYRVVLDVQ